MRIRGGRPGILPSLVVLFTSALLVRVAFAADPPADSPAPVGDDAKALAPPPPAADDKGAAAGTDAPAAPPVEAAPRRMVPSLSHDLQFGLAVMPGDGYRIVFPYTKDTTDCGDASHMDARVCTNRAPFFIDLQPSFGISHSWDVLVDLRFGVEKDFNTFHQFFVMPGFRYWLDTESHVKFFSTMQLAYDASKQQPTSKHAGSDLGFRNSNGLMVEIMRNFGVYAQFGETIGFIRWLSFTVDAGIGVQARVP
ncbi:MAG TPA: hypothetical protein VGP07_25165 [Polyangia bacterium]|jgi:hypothetical protein